MEITDIIDEFNRGNSKLITKIFGGYESFFHILSNMGLMDDIDPIHGVDNEEWANDFLLSLYYNHKIDLLNKWISESLDDIVFYDEKPYLEIRDLSDLSSWFCKDRNDSQYLVELFFNDELFDNFSNSGSWMETDGLYFNVIEDLNVNNLNLLKKNILETLKNVEIEPGTKLLHDLSDKENSPNVFITPQNIDLILKDEKTMTYLLSEYLDDIRTDLFSIYDSAYEAAYYDEVSSKIWDKLDDYFDGHPEYIEKHIYTKKIGVYRIPLKDFYEKIVDYLKSNRIYGNTGLLDYYGNYIQLIGDYHECMRLYLPDYPSNVYKYINEYFDNYI